ncbi:MAG: hypothetical protein ACXADX_18650 [Candidatus Hodarchaeales archaeon]
MKIGQAFFGVSGVILGISVVLQLTIATNSDLILLLLALVFLAAACGGISLLIDRFLQPYLSSKESEEFKQVDQQILLAQAMELKKNPRITKKAQAQKLFRLIASDERAPDDITTLAMLNLCELLLDEVKAYGEEEAFQEAEKLSKRIYKVAKGRKSPFLLVEALLLQSKFSLLKGTIPEADRLLQQAHKIARANEVDGLVTKVTQEQSRLEKEVMHWKELIARAAPLHERLDQARLQDYIANAVRVIKLEEKRRFRRTYFNS